MEHLLTSIVNTYAGYWDSLISQDGNSQLKLLRDQLIISY